MTRTILRVALSLALMTSVPELFAAIAEVNENTTANATTSDCSATQGTNFVSGNVLIVFAAIHVTTTTVSTVTAGGESLTFFGAVNRTTQTRLEMWVDKSYGGTTSAKATITLSASAACVGSVGEYSGVTSIGQITSFTSTSANPTFSQTTQDANDWLIVGFSGLNSGTFTAGTGCGTTTGNLRGSAVAGSGSGTNKVGGALCDNSNASATSISEQVTNSDTAWAVLGLELRSSSTPGIIQSFSTSCGTTCTFAFANRSGDLIVACGSAISNTTFSASDTPSNSYSSIAALTNVTINSSATSLQCFYAANIAANNSNTVTITNATNASHVAEFSGVATSSPLDVTSTNSVNTGATNPLTSNSVSSNFTNELIVGFLMDIGDGTITAGSGFTLDTASGGQKQLEWKDVSSCASYAATASGTSAGSYGFIMGTFKQTGTSSCAAATCAHTLSLLGAGCS